MRKQPSPQVLRFLAKALDTPYEELMAAAGYIDELIINALAIERLFHSITDQHIAVKKENEEYNDLLDGYTADILDDEQKAEVRALVEKWNAKCDEADDAGGVVSREQQQIQNLRQSDRQAE